MKEKIIKVKHAIKITRMNSFVLLKTLSFSYNRSVDLSRGMTKSDINDEHVEQSWTRKIVVLESGKVCNGPENEMEILGIIICFSVIEVCISPLPQLCELPLDLGLGHAFL